MNSPRTHNSIRYSMETCQHSIAQFLYPCAIVLFNEGLLNLPVFFSS
jgi:hypothetical protein